MGIVGPVVIARWSYNLIRDTGRILLDMNIEQALSDEVRRLIEADADNRIADLHVWRVGPGHFAAIVSVITRQPPLPIHYEELLKDLKELCHIRTLSYHSRGQRHLVPLWPPGTPESPAVFDRHYAISFKPAIKSPG